MKKSTSNGVRSLSPFLLLLSAFCLLLSACECHPDCTNRSLIRVEPSPLIFALTGGEKNAEVITTMCWKVISKPDWITSVTPNSGCGKTPIVVTAPATSKGRVGEIIFLADNGDQAKLIVSQGDINPTDDPTVYVAGTQTIGGTQYATLWIKGEPHLLSDQPSNATAVYVFEDDTEGDIEYVTGAINGKATLWTNGVPQPLSDKASGANSICVTESGDVYVAGWEQNEETFFTDAVYWKNGTKKALDRLHSQTDLAAGSAIYFAGRICETDFYYRATSIYVTKGGTVYVTAHGNRAVEDVQTYSCLLYTNGTPVELLGGDIYALGGFDWYYANVSSVWATEAGTVYAVGYCFLVGSAIGNFWVNGVLSYLDGDFRCTSIYGAKGGARYIVGNNLQVGDAGLFVDEIGDSGITSSTYQSVYVTEAGTVCLVNWGASIYWIDGQPQTNSLSPGATASKAGYDRCIFAR